MSFRIDKPKIKALAKPAHGRCNGTGIAGYRNAGREAIICRCVLRRLRKQEIFPHQTEAMQKAIGLETAEKKGEVGA